MEEPKASADATEAPAPATLGSHSGTEKPPLREDQVQNAVAFLSHPKVKDSPPASKRSFLERKGLTAAEIDEAFSRVPGSSAPAAPTAYAPAPTGPAAAQPYSTNQAASQGPAKPFPQQPQQPSMALSLPSNAPNAMVAQQQAMMQPQGLRWSQVVLGLGLTAAAVLAVQQYVYPYFADMYNRRVAKARAAEEAAQQREQALLEAIKGLQDNQKELQQQLSSAVKSLKDEVHAVRSSSCGGGSGGGGSGGRPHGAQDGGGSHWHVTHDTAPQDWRPNWGSTYRDSQHHSGPWSSHYNGPSGNGPNGNGLHGTGPSSNGPNGNGYHQQQGYKRAAHDEYWRGGSESTHPGSSPSMDNPPPNPSYEEVVKMLQQGITPPNVRTDINDQPPDPSHPFSESRAPPSAKPWQRGPAPPSTDTDRPFSAPSSAPSTGNAAGYSRSPVPGSQPSYAYASPTPSEPLPSHPQQHANTSILARRSGSATSLHSDSAAYSTATIYGIPTATNTSTTTTTATGSTTNILTVGGPNVDATRASVAGSGSGGGNGSGSGSGNRSGSGSGSQLFSGMAWAGKQDAVWRPPPPPTPTVALAAKANGAATPDAVAATAGSKPTGLPAPDTAAGAADSVATAAVVDGAAAAAAKAAADAVAANAVAANVVAANAVAAANDVAAVIAVAAANAAAPTIAAGSGSAAAAAAAVPALVAVTGFEGVSSSSTAAEASPAVVVPPAEAAEVAAVALVAGSGSVSGSSMKVVEAIAAEVGAV